MGRFDKFFQKMGDVADPQIQEGDETKNTENPRNWLSGKVNSVLPDDYQIPLQTVAAEKQQLKDLPQTMAGATMGAIETIPSARFGNILKQTTKEMPMGTVKVQPTAQNLYEEALKLKQPMPKQNPLDLIRQDPDMSKVLAERFQQVKNGEIPASAYDDFKQMLINQVRGVK